MKLNIIRNSVKGSALFLGMAMLICGCQREQLAGSGMTDAVTRFTVSVADMPDDGDTPATKASLHNTTGSNDNLNEYLTEFQVAAWEGTSGSTAFIPAYTKVKYQESGLENYWSTVNGSGRDVEYLWKKGETKTFFAYANLPTSGDASISNTSAASQTLELASLPDEDILMGCYSGNGNGTGTAGIHFYHPLTAVKFKQGTLSAGVSITGISIVGVYTSGKTTQTSTTGTAFAWTKTDGSAFAATDETGTVTLSSLTVDSDGFIGEAIVLIPQTFASDNSRISVSLSTPAGPKTVYYPLKGKTWAAGRNNVLTIGYDIYEYTFELADPGQATKEFTNTTAKSSAVSIAVTSKKTNASGETAEDWRIQSYRIGAGAPVDVRSTSFTGGGLEVTKSSNNLKITAQARTSTYGSHDYWVNSMKRTDRLDWSPAAWPGVTDLSKLDFKREIRNAHSMTTANCYIIRHAGTYKFPLVYGNGVIDGLQNDVAFSDAEHKNHLGAAITSAFIENNTDCTAATCEVLWQDEAAVIGTPEIVGATVTAGDYDISNVRYIQFTVNETTICQNNALIAVKDGDGNIIWSWHIWTTNDPALLADDISIVNRSSVTYYHFPLYSLGWVDANYTERETVVITLEQTYSGETATVTVNQPSVAAAGNGTYYQFGRKDPMCRKNTPAQGSFTKDGTAPVTLQVAIQHPDIFYKGTSTNQNWADSPYLHLWVNSQKKTVYDPSPVGYMIPDGGDKNKDVYNFFLQSGTDTESTELFNTDGDFSKGWNFYTGGWKTGATTFFPASGYRDYSNGDIKDVGVVGHMWTSTCTGGAQGYGWNYSATRIYKKNNFRANGFSVRPVKEQ